MTRENLKNQVNSKIVNDELSEEEIMEDIMQMVDAYLKHQLILSGIVNKDSSVCPNKKDCKLIMFTSDSDICQKCNQTFDGK